MYSHQQQVEKVYGGALHNPVDPIGSVAGITPIKNYEDLDEKVWIRDLDRWILLKTGAGLNRPMLHWIKSALEYIYYIVVSLI